MGGYTRWKETGKQLFGTLPSSDTKRHKTERIEAAIASLRAIYHDIPDEIKPSIVQAGTDLGSYLLIIPLE